MFSSADGSRGQAARNTHTHTCVHTPSVLCFKYSYSCYSSQIIVTDGGNMVEYAPLKSRTVAGSRLELFLVTTVLCVCVCVLQYCKSDSM